MMAQPRAAALDTIHDVLVKQMRGELGDTPQLSVDVISTKVGISSAHLRGLEFGVWREW